MMKQIQYFLEFIPIFTMVGVVNILPLSVSLSLCNFISRLWMKLTPKRRQVALENINRVYGNTISEEKKQELIKASFAHMALSMLELILVQKFLSHPEKHFELRGREILDRAFEQGKGLILIVTHLGSWELLAFLPYLTGYPWSVAVKDIRNPYVDRLINHQRRKMTITPIPKVGSIKTTLYELKSNHAVAILIDQWSGPDGIWVDFFGQPTSTTSIPARLAKKTGAVMVPAYCFRKTLGKYVIQVEPAIPFPENDPDWEKKVTVSLSQGLEKQILAHPKQWTWVHRRWKPKPSALRQV